MIAKKKKPKLNYDNLSMEQSLALIEKHFGVGKVILGSQLFNQKTVRIPSGSFDLDRSMGGGFAQGHAHLLWADKGTGKTTVAYRAEASFQHHVENKWIIHVAIEPFDPANAKANGVDLERILILYPDYGEEAIDIAEVLLRTGQVSLFVVDSVDSLISKAEHEGSMEDKQRGDQARLINKMLRKLLRFMRPRYDPVTKTVKYENGLTAIYISQMRINQDAGLFGDPRSIGGGKGYRHAQSIILQFDNIPKSKTIFRELKTGKKVAAGVIIGTETAWNKTYPPKIASSFNYYFSEFQESKYGLTRRFVSGQVDHSREVLSALLDLGIARGDEKKIKLGKQEYSTFKFLHMLDSKPKLLVKYMKQIAKESTPTLPISKLGYYASLARGKNTKSLPLGQKRKRRRTAPHTDV